MTRPFAGLAIATMMLAAGYEPLGAQSKDAAAATEIRTMLDRYVKAVNDADENIIRDLWAAPESVS